MLREICFNLIMWDNVKASEDWLKEQVPPVVHTSMEMIDSARDQNHSFDVMGIKQAHAYVVTGACFSIGLKYAGTAHKGAVDLLTAKVCYFKMLREKSSHWHRPDRCTGNLPGYLRISTSNGHGRYRRTENLEIVP